MNTATFSSATFNSGKINSLFGHPQGVLGLLAGAAMAAKNRAENRRVVERLGLTPGERVLEVGCGPGVAARAAARMTGVRGSVTAIDQSPEVLRLARVFSWFGRAHRVVWRVGAAEHLPVADHSVDVAFAINSWHHWEDRDAALRELNRVLGVNGRLVIAERTDASRRVNHCLLTPPEQVALTEDLRAVIGNVTVEILHAGRDTLAVISAARRPARAEGDQQ